MRDLADRLRSVGRPFTPVFVRAPSGVGKRRAGKPSTASSWPCGPGRSIRRGQLRGVARRPRRERAVRPREGGLHRRAHDPPRADRDGGGGDPFLDEITELPLRSQAKLLKFLDTMRFRRLGGQREIAVQLRVVAASNQDIEALVRSGRLREDLYHRLAVFVVALPPLCSRLEDVPDLARIFVSFFSVAAAQACARALPWRARSLVSTTTPGNVRELRNVVERAVILSRGLEITEGDVVLPTTGERPTGGNPSFLSVPPGAEGEPPSPSRGASLLLPGPGALPGTPDGRRSSRWRLLSDAAQEVEGLRARLIGRAGRLLSP